MPLSTAFENSSNPGGVCGHRHHAGGDERGAGPLEIGQRRGEVLAGCADRDAEPRLERHLHRLCGWAERLSPCDRDGLSENDGGRRGDCIVHMVRASLNYVNWKQRKRVAHDLKSIYRAATV